MFYFYSKNKKFNCCIGWERCITKSVRDKLQGNKIIVEYNKIFDYVRGSLIFKSLKDIYTAAKSIINSLK